MFLLVPKLQRNVLTFYNWFHGRERKVGLLALNPGSFLLWVLLGFCLYVCVRVLRVCVFVRVYVWVEGYALMSVWVGATLVDVKTLRLEKFYVVISLWVWVCICICICVRVFSVVTFKLNFKLGNKLNLLSIFNFPMLMSFLSFLFSFWHSSILTATHKFHILRISHIKLALNSSVFGPWSNKELLLGDAFSFRCSRSAGQN